MGFPGHSPLVAEGGRAPVSWGLLLVGEELLELGDPLLRVVALDLVLGLASPSDDPHEALDFPQGNQCSCCRPAFDVEVDGDLLAPHAEHLDHPDGDIIVDDVERCAAPGAGAESLEHVDRQRPGFGVVEVSEDAQGEYGRPRIVEAQLGSGWHLHVSIPDSLAGDLVEVLGRSHFPFFPRLMRQLYYTLYRALCQYTYGKKEAPYEVQ